MNDIFGYFFGAYSRSYITRTISKAENGDVDALKMLIRILRKKARRFPPNLSSNEMKNRMGDAVDGEISGCLLGIFFSKRSTPEQKRLIWKIRKTVIGATYTRHVLPPPSVEAKYSLIRSGADPDDLSEYDSSPTMISEPYTLYDAIRKRFFRSNKKITYSVY